MSRFLFAPFRLLTFALRCVWLLVEWLFRILFASIGFLFRILWAAVKLVFRILRAVVRLVFYLLTAGPVRSLLQRKAARGRSESPLLDTAWDGLDGDFAGESLPAKPREAIVKVGSIVPVEQDDDLRVFRVLNGEGELFEVDTSVPGPFHGPVWTRILGCYEQRETLRGRIGRRILDREGRAVGCEILIGDVAAFMPSRHAMRAESGRGVNVRVAVTRVDLNERLVTVSARLAYELLFARKKTPAIGETADALCWDYDEENVYLLLPGHYMGRAVYGEKEADVAARMGELTRCRIEELRPEEREALVSLAAFEPAGSPLS